MFELLLNGISPLQQVLKLTGSRLNRHFGLYTGSEPDKPLTAATKTLARPHHCNAAVDDDAPRSDIVALSTR